MLDENENKEKKDELNNQDDPNKESNQDEQNIDTTEANKPVDRSKLDALLGGGGSNPALERFVSVIAQQQRQIEELKAGQSRVEDENEDPKELLERPRKLVKDVVREEMSAQMKPVNELLAQFARDRALKGNLGQFKTNDPIGRQLAKNPQVEELTLQFLANADPTPDNIRGAALMAFGMVGLAGGGGNGTENTERRGGSEVREKDTGRRSPGLDSDAPRPPERPKGDKPTEDQAAAMRAFNMNPNKKEDWDEFKRLMNSDSVSEWVA